MDNFICSSFGELCQKNIPPSPGRVNGSRLSQLIEVYATLARRMQCSGPYLFLKHFANAVRHSSLADAVTIVAIGSDHSELPFCLASVGEDFSLRCHSEKDVSQVRYAGHLGYPSLFASPNRGRPEDCETLFVPFLDGAAVIAFTRNAKAPSFNRTTVDELANLCGLLTFSQEKIRNPIPSSTSVGKINWETEALSLAASVAGLGFWDWDILRDEVNWTDEHFRLEGYEVGEIEPSYEAWLNRVHPQDRAEAVNALSNAMKDRLSFRHKFRSLHPDGSIRWLLGSGRFFYDDSGAARRMIGAMVDITDTQEGASCHQRMVGDLEHRLASLLSLTRYIFTCSFERAPNYQAAIAHFPGRLSSLARAERRAAPSSDSTVDLERLILDELEAVFPRYSEKTGMSGPPTRIPLALSRPLSLAVHELAINAFEHGAYAHVDGMAEIFWEVNLDKDGNRVLTLQWTEKEVRLIQLTGMRPGFGMEFLEKEFRRRTGADVDLSMKRGGLTYRAELPLDQGAELFA